MLIIMSRDATEAQVDAVVKEVERLGHSARVANSASTALSVGCAATGDRGARI